MSDFVLEIGAEDIPPSYVVPAYRQLAADAEALLAQVAKSNPDLVLLHWRLRGGTAADLLPNLREVLPKLAVIVLSGHPEVEAAAMVAGADAFVSKADPPELLLEAIAATERSERPARAAS